MHLAMADLRFKLSHDTIVRHCGLDPQSLTFVGICNAVVC
jgi:hypothetical protein